MLASEIARNVIYRSIKDIYYKRLSDMQKDSMDDDEIVELVNHIYKDRRSEIEEEIWSDIREKMVGKKYPGDEYVEELIEDIIEDEDLAKTRVRTEIKLYQSSKKRSRKL